MNRDFYGFYTWIFVTLALPYVPVVLPFFPSRFAGFNLTGWAWITMLMVCIYYFFKKPNSEFPVKYWIPWVIYLFVYLLFEMSFFGVQLSLQYVLPVFVGMVASGFRYGKEEFHWLFKRFMVLSFLMFVMFMLDYFVESFHTAHWATSSIFITIPAAVLIGLYFMTKKIKFLLFYGALFLVPFLNVTRMALLVFVVIFIAHFANYRILSKATYSVLGVLMLLAVFYSKEFQEKTFYEGEGALTDLSINYYEDSNGVNTSGRRGFYRHFEKGLRQSPVWGNGPRADYYVMRSFTGLNDAHNDYLSVRYNYGYVGLGLLLYAFGGSFLSVYRRYRYYKREKEAYGFLIASTTLVLFFAFMMFMYTDNILKYTIFFPNIFFAMIGMVFAKPKEAS